MNSITAKSSNRANQIMNNKPVESVETAGSLAMLGNNKSWLATNIYDSFISSNPFSVDYSQYSNVGFSDCSTSEGGFLSSFSSAVSTLGSSSSDGGSASFSGASCGSSSGGSCGGFTSVC